MTDTFDRRRRHNTDIKRAQHGLSSQHGIPLAEDKHGLWVLVAIVITFTVVAAWVAFRKKR